MANPFLNSTDLMDRDIETAVILEQAHRLNIGNAVAYTDGDRVFINTEDNLYEILPAYDQRMLKWLLWHEKYHKELRHHNRFFKYLEELDNKKLKDKFYVTKEEVNIIMDILVHDSLAKLFPELVETALNNLAQMRNRNSLAYTFKTFTLEQMLDEYAKHKKEKDGGKGADEDDRGGAEDDKKTSKDKKEDSKPGKTSKKEPPKDKSTSKKDKKADEEDSSAPSNKAHRDKPDIADTPSAPPETGEHDKTDWSKLKDLDSKEFIDKSEGDYYVDQINKMKRVQAKLGKLTETINGLVSAQRQRTYSMPSTIHVGNGVLLKGSKPGRVALALCFDASGSMGGEMEMFQEVISKSIPQAMTTPTAWFSGHVPDEIKSTCRDENGRSYDYYKGPFSDFMKVGAQSGYSDDGDRTIELCLLAEKKGLTPIGITDGGGQISWSKSMLKQLQRTILVGQNQHWLDSVKEINPTIQTLCL